jgi:hypothetical protein
MQYDSNDCPAPKEEEKLLREELTGISLGINPSPRRENEEAAGRRAKWE